MGKKNRETIGLLYQLSDAISTDRHLFSEAAATCNDKGDSSSYDTYANLVVYSHDITARIEELITLAEQDEASANR